MGGKDKFLDGLQGGNVATRNLGSLLHPGSIGLIGASADQRKL